VSETDLAEGQQAYCRYCDMEIEVSNLRTGREFFGPFWRLGWMHIEGGQKCWSPYASPKGK
jgi:hypothetical protein